MYIYVLIFCVYIEYYVSLSLFEKGFNKIIRGMIFQQKIFFLYKRKNSKVIRKRFYFFCKKIFKFNK